MKKFITLILIMLICVSTVFSQGTYEKAYDDFWKILDDYYPELLLAEKDGLDLKALESAGREQVKNIKSEEELAIILRSIAGRLYYLDYIEISIQSKSESGRETTANSQYAPSYQYIPSLKTIVFYINSLSFSNDFLASVLNEVEDVEHIVFDLTTCSSMSNNLDPILSPFGGSWSYNYTGYLKNEDVAKFFPELEIRKTDENTKAYEYGLTYTLERTVNYEYGDGKIEGEAKDAKRWILISSQTGFGADYLSSFAKDTGWATVVGTPTPGNGTGLPMLTLSLSNTNILVSFNPLVLDDGKGDLKTRSGNKPDILSTEGKTPLSTCISMIENT